MTFVSQLTNTKSKNQAKIIVNVRVQEYEKNVKFESVIVRFIRAGSSANSLDGSSSTEAVNTNVSAPSTADTLPVVIELTQQLTSKRPLRSEAARERRSSTVGRSINGDAGGGGGVCSSPSQNSIESVMSSSSDDVPPPLPAKQSVSEYGGAAPEKPLLQYPPLGGIREDSPPLLQPKKPVRPLPPKL